MRKDRHEQVILTETELCELYLKNPDRKIKYALSETPITFSQELELDNAPKIIEWIEDNLSTQEFDRKNQQHWHMPSEYQELDIASWVLEQCHTDAQRQRVGEELLLYLDRDLFSLLQYLKYLVDTMRQHGVVWGVGRGSSVASYVLYLIGVHRIDSLYYGLDIKEFLR